MNETSGLTLCPSKIRGIPYKTNSEFYFNKLKHLPYCCWLDSAKPYSSLGRYDILSALPVKRLVTHGTETQINTLEYAFKSSENPLQASAKCSIRASTRSTADPFDLLEQERLALTSTNSTLVENRRETLPFIGGLIGYLSYDLGLRYFNIPTQSTPFADMQIGVYLWAVIQDHHQKEAFLVALPECDTQLFDQLDAHLRINCFTDCSTKNSSFTIDTNSLTSNLSKQAYLQALKTIRHYIESGDCYQVNFTQQFVAHYHGDPYSAYLRLRQNMASPFSAYLQSDTNSILSFSPERFLKIQQGYALSQPIKGTCQRHQDDTMNQSFIAKLKASEKNRAENIMIVDLLRNDFGKQCITGSITASKLCEIQSFNAVHHLVSNIQGRLLNSTKNLKLFRDCFPGGSITGAPKKRAMEIIAELEPQARGPYCGSIAYINYNGDMDSSIVIRTIVCDDEKLYCSAGGGIVFDSEPEEEYQESFSKIQTILDLFNSPFTF